jgi:hypothetical protein
MKEYKGLISQEVINYWDDYSNKSGDRFRATIKQMTKSERDKFYRIREQPNSYLANPPRPPRKYG